MVQNDDIYGNGYYVDNNNIINPFIQYKPFIEII